ncbi:50S ribosomal protein L1 [Suttonella ornithocola]|uniref:Large ribosomal subunit protein uL1 n=1 Tax=Suttonella ornithocola TaxID=279832 RepID=A0A380MQ04_9GAMM|nr:50S ribosomal protein L1 [Suttonella ornithocola]SUO94680.1 50S ribosomal protein L1 [Suttonella ornithocola]
MAKLTKRQKEIREKLGVGKVYNVIEALDILKSLSKVKFVESVDVALQLGIDPRKSDQVVRGAAVLPNGTGKTVRVAVFAQGDNADAAKAAGADIVGMDELADEIKGGRSDFDVVIAEPAAMRVVGALGQVLGPRGLMPNPKVGTVTADVKTAVENAKAGQVRFRADKGGVVHAIIGKVDFDSAKLAENLQALVNEVNKLRPAAAKGVYLQKAYLSTTMGPGLAVDVNTLTSTN